MVRQANRDRIEHDTMGPVRVPRNAMWGAQTQRAVENFPVSGLRMPPVFTHVYMLLKKSAAVANHAEGTLDRKRAKAISDTCDDILGSSRGLRFDSLLKRLRGADTFSSQSDDLRNHRRGEWISSEWADQFVVDAFQAGAGTSFHMNCNEVIANLANKRLGGRVGTYDPVHPNDHVNMSQSTNDTFPTAMRVAVLLNLRELLPALDQLAGALREKGAAFEDVVKSGRTHLQDAVPVTLGMEFDAWASAIERSTRSLVEGSEHLRELGIGGTAVGTGLNTPPNYAGSVVDCMQWLTELRLESASDPREAMQSQQPIVAISAALRNLTLELTRIANDLRLLSSGPSTGLAEIRLPEVQPGSSIMPGKVNPSILECLNMVCIRVVGADTAVSMASQAGQLELNVMMPVMAFEVLFAIEILKNILPIVARRCITGIAADRERCERYFERSPAIVTALNPIIGYERAAEIAKKSIRTGQSIREILQEEKVLDEDEIDRILLHGPFTGRNG